MTVDNEKFSPVSRAFAEWWADWQDDPAITTVIRDIQTKWAGLARKAFLAGYAAWKKGKDRIKSPVDIKKGFQNKTKGESKNRILRPKDVSEIFGIPAGTLANLRYNKKGPKYYKYPGGEEYSIFWGRLRTGC